MAQFTLQQEMGQYDPDLTPDHDRAMFWLDEWIRQHMEDAWDCQLKKIEWEYHLSPRRLFLDIAAWCEPKSATGIIRTMLYAFEVKPRLYSLGELLRQLKIYRFELDQPPRNFDDFLITAVVPAHAGWERILRQEEFGYLPLPPDLSDMAGKP